MKEGKDVTNTLRIGKATEQQNLIFKEKTCAHKTHNTTKPFTSAQRAQYNKNISINIYISGYPEDIKYI